MRGRFYHFLFTFLYVCLLLNANAFAVQYEFVGVASEVILKGTTKADLSQSVGAFTMKILEEAQAQKLLKFEGSATALSSVNDLTTDKELEDYEIISDTEMNAYGWCFTLDGVRPEKMPDQVFFDSDQVVLRWFYAFAHYESGKWDMCLPVKSKRVH